MKTSKCFLYLATLVALGRLLWPAALSAQEEIVCERDVTVQADDWLSKIAEKEYGDVLLYPALVAATNAQAATDSSYPMIEDNDVIEPGWKICVPGLAMAQALAGSGVSTLPPALLTLAELENATYSGIYEQPVTLSEGFYEGEPFSPDSPLRPAVSIISNGVRFGDLDGDGVEDAGVFLVENSGGSGSFIYVAAQLNQAGQPVEAGTVLVGDRIQIKSAAIENGQVVLEIVTQGPEDAQCCPSLKVRKTYALLAGRLAETGSENLGSISAADLNGATWRLVDLNSDQQPALAGTEVTLSFQGGQLSGSGGCNNYTSSFSLDEANLWAMTINPIAATRRACPEPMLNQETAYFTALENVRQWGYQAGQLALFYETEPDDFGTLRFAPPAAAEQAGRLTASTWQWIRLTDPQQQVEIDSPENYTLTFLPDGSVQIKADCNQATASYTATEGGSLSITPGISTLVACPPGSRGEEFVQKLGFSAIYFFQDGHLFIDLMADDGAMEFSPQPAASQPAANVTATEMITFTPTAIPTETRPGSCFTNAIGLGREDAYRCTVGNQLFDPCFAVDDVPTIVCGANPASGETGFVLALTEPLPAPEVGQLSKPWLVELADGQVCGLLTGTVPGAGDRVSPYGCPDGSYLFEEFQQDGEVWLAEKAVIGLNDDGFFVEQSEMVPIRRVWQ